MGSLLNDDDLPDTPTSEDQLGLFVPLQPELLKCERPIEGSEIPYVQTHEYSTIMTFMNAHGGKFFDALAAYYESKQRLKNRLAARAVY